MLWFILHGSLFLSHSKGIFELRNHVVLTDHHLEVIFSGIDEGLLLVPAESGSDEFVVGQGAAGAVDT